MSLFYMGDKITVINQPERQVKKMLSLVKKFSIEEAGQGMVEYVFILMLVALAVIASLGILKDGIVNSFQKTENGFR